MGFTRHFPNVMEWLLFSFVRTICCRGRSENMFHEHFVLRYKNVTICRILLITKSLSQLALLLTSIQYLQRSISVWPTKWFNSSAHHIFRNDAVVCDVGERKTALNTSLFPSLFCFYLIFPESLRTHKYVSFPRYS